MLNVRLPMMLPFLLSELRHAGLGFIVYIPLQAILHTSSLNQFRPGAEASPLGGRNTYPGNVHPMSSHLFLIFYSWFRKDGCADYCSISFNSTGPVTRDRPVEILVSTTTQIRHDKPKIWANFRPFNAAGDENFRHLSQSSRRFRHLTKICVTTVTFRQFEGPRDA